MASIFDKMKEAAKEGIEKSNDPAFQEEMAARKLEKKMKALEITEESIRPYLGPDETLLAQYLFYNDRMYATDRKLIFLEKKLAKESTYIIVPYDSIRAYKVVVPTGLSVKSKLKIYVGGSEPIIDVEANFTDPTYGGITQILAEKI